MLHKRRKEIFVGEACAIRGAMRRICAAAVAVSVFVVLAFSAQAYAADSILDLQTMQATSPTSVCINTAAVKTTAVKTKVISKRSLIMTMAGGDSAIIGTSKTGSKLTWSVSNKKIVRVKTVGKYRARITALKPGKTTITAKSGNRTILCKVIVTGALSETQLTTTPLETCKLRLKGAKAKKWKTSDSSIAAISNEGALTPKATGSATITCIDKKGYKYKCSVTIACPDITCLMDPDLSNPIAKWFTFTNRSGESIVLGDGPIKYYPDDSAEESFTLYGISDSSNVKSFSDCPVAVADQESYSFAGIDNQFSYRTEAGVFGMYFDVGSTKYYARFFTNGVMAACGRA